LVSEVRLKKMFAHFTVFLAGVAQTKTAYDNNGHNIRDS
jgi:hypothetical protein